MRALVKKKINDRPDFWESGDGLNYPPDIPVKTIAAYRKRPAMVVVMMQDSSQRAKKAFGDKEAEAVVAGIIKARAVDVWTIHPSVRNT